MKVKTGSKKARARGKIPEENVLSIYLKEISHIPLLTREEEEKIARAVANGDSAARERLIKGNLRFVVNVAKKYQGRGIPLADLINEGNIGLIKAVEKFDATKGYRFISYAVWWVRQSILKALSEKSRLIRLPVNRAADLIRIQKAKKILSGNSADDIEVQEIAHLLNMDENHVEDMMAISREIISLEKEVNVNKGASPLGNFIEDIRYESPDQVVIQEALESDIDKMLDTLDIREAEIIRSRYGLGNNEPLSLKELGDRYDLSKERIRQIEQKALTRLQHPSRLSRLEAYVA